MNYFDAVDFSECHSEEVMFLLTLSVCITTLSPVPTGTINICFIKIYTFSSELAQQLSILSYLPK